MLKCKFVQQVFTAIKNVFGYRTLILTSISFFFGFILWPFTRAVPFHYSLIYSLCINREMCGLLGKFKTPNTPAVPRERNTQPRVATEIKKKKKNQHWVSKPNNMCHVLINYCYFSAVSKKNKKKWESSHGKIRKREDDQSLNSETGAG